MNRRMLMLVFTFVFGAVIGRYAIPATHLPFAAQNVVMAQTQKSVTIVHLYTGADNQTHEEDVPAIFNNGALDLLPIKGASLHTESPGMAKDWHHAPHRQYIITLSGHGEIEVADGKKFQIDPGQIDLVEDVTGKGHKTRTTGTEDLFAVWLPIADDAPPIALPK